MPKKSPEQLVPVQFRLPKSLLERLDEYAADLCRANPAMRFTRTDAVRVLLMDGLPQKVAVQLVRPGNKPTTTVLKMQRSIDPRIVATVGSKAKGHGSQRR